ncbi:MAG TPA: cyclophilin-like fold protein [Patescibacteria group bacterium]|nr:cyclophilin-like fold protein [Patescibacteria group bacterium]
MTRRIKILSPSVGEVHAELTDENPKTADKIWEALPLQAKASTWGQEIYFSIPVEIEDENAKEVVEKGDLGYWPPGSAFCIFFGLTPASRGNEIRPASPVNVFGRVLDGPEVFMKVRSGDRIEIDRA